MKITFKAHIIKKELILWIKLNAINISNLHQNFNNIRIATYTKRTNKFKKMWININNNKEFGNTERKKQAITTSFNFQLLNYFLCEEKHRNIRCRWIYCKASSKHLTFPGWITLHKTNKNGDGGREQGIYFFYLPDFLYRRRRWLEEHVEHICKECFCSKTSKVRKRGLTRQRILCLSAES